MNFGRGVVIRARNPHVYLSVANRLCCKSGIWFPEYFDGIEEARIL